MNKMLKLAIFGAGGFGREVLPMVRLFYRGDCDLVFVDDEPSLWGKTVNDVKVVSVDQAVGEKRQFSMSIANPGQRRKRCEALQERGARFFSARAAATIIYDQVDVGEGSILCANFTATSNIKIGRQFHGNIFSYVAHDCVIGDYVTFAPYASCGGRVIIEDDVYIGMGALIKQGVPGKHLVIGQGAVVGMGAVVTKDVPAGATVVGNPAKVMEKRN